MLARLRTVRKPGPAHHPRKMPLELGAPTHHPRKKPVYAWGVDALYSDDGTLVELVEAVRAIPYGRPSERTVDGMLRDRRGTCSTKHLFLARAVAERFPDTEPEIVHRVHRIERADARRLFGDGASKAVPTNGLVDVHRYLTANVEGRRIILDATFSGPPWDGRSPLPLACGPGPDVVAVSDPDAEKRALEAKHCDPKVREPFIAALA